MHAPELLENVISAELTPEERPFQSIAGDFAVLCDGSILYAGAGGTPDAPRLCFWRSDNGGRSFDMFPSLSLENALNPSFCRKNDGTLTLFFLNGGGLQAVDIKEQPALRFSERSTVIPQKKGTKLSVGNGRAYKSADGTVRIPAVQYPLRRSKAARPIEAPSGRIFLYELKDGWTEAAATAELPAPPLRLPPTGVRDPGLAQTENGTLCCYFATNKHAQFVSTSTDGAHWTVPSPSHFSSPVSPMLLTRDPFTGRCYAIWNPVPLLETDCEKKRRFINGGRTPLAVAASTDGVHFSDMLLLETDPVHGFSNPAAIFTKANTMLLAYTCGGVEDGNCLNRARIRYLVFK